MQRVTVTVTVYSTTRLQHLYGTLQYVVLLCMIIQYSIIARYSKGYCSTTHRIGPPSPCSVEYCVVPCTVLGILRDSLHHLPCGTITYTVLYPRRNSRVNITVRYCTEQRVVRIRSHLGPVILHHARELASHPRCVACGCAMLQYTVANA